MIQQRNDAGMITKHRLDTNESMTRTEHKIPTSMMSQSRRTLLKEKLDELYPRQTLAVGPWNVTIGRGSEYKVQRADLWDEQRRRSWQ